MQRVEWRKCRPVVREIQPTLDVFGKTLTKNGFWLGQERSDPGDVRARCGGARSGVGHWTIASPAASQTEPPEPPMAVARRRPPHRADGAPAHVRVFRR